MNRVEARAALAAACAEDRLALDEGAALLAVEELDGGEPAGVLTALDRLAASIFVPPGADLYGFIARLNHKLFSELKLQGDEAEYDHPRNSLLPSVLERRRGLPILLCIVVIEVSRRLGVEIDGVSFPGHFVVSPRGADPRFWLDPFNGGAVLREEGLRSRLHQMAGAQDVDPEAWARFIAPVGADAILARVNNNLKGSYARRGDLDGVLRAVERNLVLRPDELDEQRSRGLLLAELGRVEEARVALEATLVRETDPTQETRVLRFLRGMRRR
jgi:regulator of sirC expression with transglutaminase-like and TPR domain